MKTRLFLLTAGPVILSALVLTALYTTPFSYLYCLARESSWMRSKTRHELESRLIAFYSIRETDPALTVWTQSAPWNLTPPRGDQKVLSYTIFAKERLDVLMTGDGEIVDMFPAYE
ncbi:MAG: hypothetical protein EOP87_12210 [Verrucomicrobiaceae bacterium]|nr:MAG: hypothetical protein EOP87_12210 [Verrucomicrobiaceae bacterium]